MCIPLKHRNLSPPIKNQFPDQNVFENQSQPFTNLKLKTHFFFHDGEDFHVYKHGFIQFHAQPHCQTKTISSSSHNLNISRAIMCWSWGMWFCLQTRVGVVRWCITAAPVVSNVIQEKGEGKSGWRPSTPVESGHPAFIMMLGVGSLGDLHSVLGDSIKG